MQKGKQTNKKGKRDGAGRRRSPLSFKYHIQWPGLPDAKPSPFPAGVHFSVTATSHAGKIVVIPHIFYPQKRLPCPGLGD